MKEFAGRNAMREVCEKDKRQKDCAHQIDDDTARKKQSDYISL